MNWVTELLAIADKHDGNLMDSTVLMRGRELWQLADNNSGPFVIDGSRRFKTIGQLAQYTGFSQKGIKQAIADMQLMTNHPLMDRVYLGDFELRYQPIQKKGRAT